MQHSLKSAGRLMSNEFFAFTMDTTIGEAAEQIRENPGIDLTRRVFVLSQEGKLQGFVPARNLIINPSDLPLKQVMQSLIHKVSPDASRDEVVDLVERYKISALPVVDQNDHILGVISYEDVVEALEEITDEGFARMAGTAEDVGENEPTFKRFFSRSPWLIITLFSGLLTVTVIALAEQLQERWFTSLLFVVPLVTAMSGNVGIQCSTVLIRNMATGAVSAGSIKGVISKELLVGLMTGITFGFLGGLIVYSFDILGIHGDPGPSSLTIAFIVGTGIFSACLVASAMGVFSPLFFARLGTDPAIAAGPVVTAFNDVFSTIMYIFIAYSISSFFL